MVHRDLMQAFSITLRKMFQERILSSYDRHMIGSSNDHQGIPKGLTQVQDVTQNKNGTTKSRLVYQTCSDPTVPSGSPIGVTFSGTPHGATGASLNVNQTESTTDKVNYFI